MLNMWAHEDCLLSFVKGKILIHRLDNSLRMAIVFHQAFMGWALSEGKGAVQIRDFKGGTTMVWKISIWPQKKNKNSIMVFNI